MLTEGLSGEQLRALKVRSGEHVAAIVAATIHFESPTAVDVDGGPDLQFRPSDDWDPAGVPIVYEVKSVAGDFREFLARSDDAGAPEGFETTVREVDGLVREISHVVQSGADTLLSKVPRETSRNVLLVLHPFDEFPIELLDETSELLIGAALSVDFFDTGLDSVTLVVMPPGSVAQWCRSRGGWQSFVFAASEEANQSGLPPFMKAESEFMARVQPTIESPYTVWLSPSVDKPPAR